VLVIRYEADIEPPRREVFNNPRLRLGIPQTLREGNVDVRPEPFAERESRRRVDNGGDRREIRDPFGLLEAAEPQRIEPNGAAGKAKHFTREVADDLRANEGRVGGSELIERPTGEQQCGDVRQ